MKLSGRGGASGPTPPLKPGRPLHASFAGWEDETGWKTCGCVKLEVTRVEQQQEEEEGRESVMKGDEGAEESLTSGQARRESAYSLFHLFIYSSGRGNYFPQRTSAAELRLPPSLFSPFARLSPNLQPKQLTDFATVGNYGS